MFAVVYDNRYRSYNHNFKLVTLHKQSYILYIMYVTNAFAIRVFRQINVIIVNENS